MQKTVKTSIAVNGPYKLDCVTPVCLDIWRVERCFLVLPSKAYRGQTPLWCDFNTI